MSITTKRSYRELSQLGTLEERYRYLSLGGVVGQQTFGSERYLNQNFYTSRAWKEVRQEVIIRDDGLDLGIEGYDIPHRIYIHHMNPMTIDDIMHGNDDILDPEFLISVSHGTHNAIHYGDESQLPRIFVPRRPGDTKLW